MLEMREFTSITEKEHEGYRVELLEDTTIFQRALDSYIKLLTASGQKSLLDQNIEGFGKFNDVT